MNKNNNRHNTIQIPRRVRFLENIKDFDVLFLAACGFSAKLIASETGYSPAQVSYRLHRAGVKIGNYRNGDTNFSRRIITEGRGMATEELAEHLSHNPDAIGGKAMRVKTIMKHLELLEKNV